MDFFDKKEDVLDFQLTEYGKYLLQNGVLEPAYYAFFDDDILYDSEAGGFSEAQNLASRRIKYETPALKVQPNTTGVESRVAAFLESATGSAGFSTIAENSVSFVDAFNTTPQFEQKFFINAAPVGTSDLKSPYAPAWHLNFLANEAASTQNYDTINLTSSLASLGEGMVQPIPQLNLNIDYKNFFADVGALEVLLETNDDIDPSERLFEDVSINQIANFVSDGSIGLFVKEDYLILQVEEKNTEHLKENFDIEVYEEASDGKLTRLTFIGDQAQMLPTTDENVEYYMNILVDDEIPADLMEDVGVSSDQLRGQAVRIQLRRDLYTTEDGGTC